MAKSVGAEHDAKALRIRFQTPQNLRPNLKVESGFEQSRDTRRKDMSDAILFFVLKKRVFHMT